VGAVVLLTGLNHLELGVDGVAEAGALDRLESGMAVVGHRDGGVALYGGRLGDRGIHHRLLGHLGTGDPGQQVPLVGVGIDLGKAGR
jgi:hypothetical protein